MNDSKVQQACRVIARLLLGDAGPQEARRTALAVLIAATGNARTEDLPAAL